MGRDRRCLALIAALTLATDGACGGGGSDAPADAAGLEGAAGDDVADEPIEDDVPPTVCPASAGEIDNAACNDVVANGPCVGPVMIDDNAPGPQGGDLVPGTYDLSERIVYTSAGGATGPAGDPLRQTIVLTGSAASFALAEATASAIGAQRRTVALAVNGTFMQLRASVTCPSADPSDGGTAADAGGAPDAATAGTTTLYYTASGETLTIYQVAASGPIQADTYSARGSGGGG
jgi:hypothetical protein